MIFDGKVGFIGGGNMSYAVAMGIVKGGSVPPQKMLISNRTAPKLKVFETEGMHVTLDNIEVLSKCDIVFLGVKPYVFPIIVEEIKNRGSDIDLSGKIFVSLMAGIRICDMEKFFVAIEALADGAVMHGVPRALAIELASRAVQGAGKLALEAGKHTEELKDSVASPAGSTIRGLYALEKAGFRAALIDAVHATCTPLKK